MEMRSKSKRERKKENEKELRVLFASFELEQEKYIQCTGRYSETELIWKCQRLRWDLENGTFFVGCSFSSKSDMVLYKQIH